MQITPEKAAAFRCPRWSELPGIPLYMDQVVLVLEDLHASDPATIDVITLLAQRPAPLRLLVVGNYRPADVAVREHALASALRTMLARGQ